MLTKPRCTSLPMLHECPLIAEPLQWVELECPTPLLTWNMLWWWFVIYILLFTFGCGSIKCDSLSHNHVALWYMELPQVYIWIDLRPLSKLRGRGSFHINFPHPLDQMVCTSKWQLGFPLGEVLWEFHEYVSKSGTYPECSHSGNCKVRLWWHSQ